MSNRNSPRTSGDAHARPYRMGAPMSDLELHYKQHVKGFDQRGQVSERTEPPFVKLLTSFRFGFLRSLKGPRLSVFICVALHDADEVPGCSLVTMCEETGYTKPSVIEAIRYLSDAQHRFIEEAGLESDGTRRFRVVAFAYFGRRPPNGRSGKIALPPLGDSTPRGRSRAHVADKIAGRSPRVPEQAVKKDFAGGKNGFYLHDDGTSDDIKNNHSEKTSSIHEGEVRELFEPFIAGVNLDRLAATVAPNIARAWADWMSRAPRTQWRNPAGYCYQRLSADPEERPPYVAEARSTSRPRAPSITGRLARRTETGAEDE